MIKLSKFMREYIENQKSMEDFAEILGVSRQTVYNILDDSEGLSTKTLELLSDKTGIRFEKAFEVIE